MAQNRDEDPQALKGRIGRLCFVVVVQLTCVVVTRWSTSGSNAPWYLIPEVIFSLAAIGFSVVVARLFVRLSAEKRKETTTSG